MPNRLSREQSAYLRQHGENPVDWYPWGSEAFERARTEDRPVLVSIGYSSCHWCHVMERESFEDPETASLMNKHLVCIKVDREERPDVDQIYMEAVMRTTGSGGWPLNVFCTPEGMPFFGGTYFPPRPTQGRPSWSEVVASIARIYKESPAKVDEQAKRIVEALRARPVAARKEIPGRDSLRELTRALLKGADPTHGGFGGAPKFPTPTYLEGLLFAGQLGVGALGSVEHVVLTLHRMARGGIYDQLGGGFHRYSVDARWLIPHFEKMLYDQGQLLRVYAETYRQTGDPELLWPVEETIAFLERELSSPLGGFYASQDADSEGKEGLYYVWTPDQIREVLGDEAGRSFCDAYGVHPQGNFEQSEASVLSHVLAGERSRLEPQRARLLEARSGRIAPPTDTKQITAWIGYTISGLSAAAAAYGRAEWIVPAERAARFVLDRLTDTQGNLLRVGYDDAARIPAFLDDHAAMVAGLLDLHRAGGPDWCVEEAVRLGAAILDRFYDADARDLFYVPSDVADLILRPGTDPDGATPAAGGLATLGLVRLAAITGRSDFQAAAEAVLSTWHEVATREPARVPTLLKAGSLLETGCGAAIIIGEPEDPRTLALAARGRELLSSEEPVMVVRARPEWFDPSWLEGRPTDGNQPTAYICRGTSCSLPATEPDALELPPDASRAHRGAPSAP